MAVLVAVVVDSAVGVASLFEIDDLWFGSVLFGMVLLGVLGFVVVLTGMVAPFSPTGGKVIIAFCCSVAFVVVFGESVVESVAEFAAGCDWG